MCDRSFMSLRTLVGWMKGVRGKRELNGRWAADIKVEFRCTAHKSGKGKDLDC